MNETQKLQLCEDSYFKIYNDYFQLSSFKLGKVFFHRRKRNPTEIKFLILGGGEISYILGFFVPFLGFYTICRCHIFGAAELKTG